MSSRYMVEAALRDLDPVTVWNLVGDKVLSYFKVWDLLFLKVARYGSTGGGQQHQVHQHQQQQLSGDGLQHLAGEVDLIVRELRQFLTGRCDAKARQTFLTCPYLDQNVARAVVGGADDGSGGPFPDFMDRPIVTAAHYSDSSYVEKSEYVSCQIAAQKSQAICGRVPTMTKSTWVQTSDLGPVADVGDGETLAEDLRGQRKRMALLLKKNKLRIRQGPPSSYPLDSLLAAATAPACKSCILCRACKKFRNKSKVRVEYADHFPVTREQFLETIAGGSPYRCDRCHMEFLTKQGFTTHLNSKCTGMVLPKPRWRKVDSRYFCEMDGCQANSQGRSWCTTTGVWAHHYAEHESFANLPYVCPECPSKSFPTKTLLSNHRQEKHVVLKKQHPCRFCQKLFTTRSILRVHERSHTGEKPFGCDLCEFRATSFKRVQAHKKRQHEDRPKNHVCDVCGKGFLLRYQLKEHLNTHAEVKTHPCNLCGKVLKNFNSLRRHMIRSHGIGFTCEICGGSDFGTKQGLLKHKRDKHGMHI